MSSLKGLALFCLVACPAIVSAAELTSAELQKVVASSVKRYTEAFKARDAKTLATLFTDEAEYIDDAGVVFHGRKTIEAELKAAFAQNPLAELAVDVTSIRPIAAGVIAEEGVSTVTPKDGPATRTRYTITHVKQSDGTWLIASVRELESTETAPHERLKQLAWLLGNWREELGDSVVKSEWKWSEDGNFLLSDFAVVIDGKPLMKGTHRVGWDAERQQLRSWIFDASGGHSDGWWTGRADGSWSVQLTGIGSTGVRRSCVMTYLPDGPNAIAVTQEKRVQAGISLPDSAHRVVRETPEPQAAPAKR